MNFLNLPIKTTIMSIMGKAADKASRILSRNFNDIDHLQVSKKKDNSIVTNVDILVNEVVMDTLLYARPRYSFLSEEIEEKNGEDPYRWIVDPLDGTSNFVHGLYDWNISIALEDLEKKEVIAGIIYNPIRDEIFCAEKGCGAFMNNRRLRVSNRNRISDAFIAVKKIQMKEAILAEQICAGVRKLGSSSINFAYLAASKFDAFFLGHSSKSIWDVAAGLVLLKEAGGVSIDKNWCPTNDCSAVMLATTLDILPEIEKAFK